MKQRPHFEEKHILAIFIYPPPLQGGENANRGGGKIYRIGNGSIRACLRGKVKRYPDVEVSPPPRRRERGVQRRRPRPERDNRGGSGCDEDERDKGIDNIIEVKKKKRRKFNFSERGDVEQ